MTAAVIGASSESIYAIQKAKELGLEVVALDGNPEAPGLKAADASFVVDIRKPEEVIKILEKYDIKLVLPVPIGRYLTTTGAVNDHFGLPGVSLAAAELSTDKYEFHRVLAEKGLRDAELYLIRQGECDSDVSELNIMYPVVVKPRYGSGSRGVEIFDSPKALADGFIAGEPYDEDYVVESCIPGPEYGVDGVFVNGKFNLILLRGKRNTPPPYRECVGYYAVSDSPEDRTFVENVKKHMQAVGKALGFENNVVHADIIRREGDKPFLIETSARPSGHNLHNLFTPMASGVDEVSEFIKASVPELGLKASFEPSESKMMMIRYFDFENVRIGNVPAESYIKEKYPVKAWQCNLERGMVPGKVIDGHSLMTRGYFIVEADSLTELEDQCDRIKSEFQPEELK